MDKKITMLESRPGSVNGHDVKNYQKGHSYDLDPDSDLGKVFIENGWAKPYVKPVELEKHENKKNAGRAPSNKKMAPPPVTKKEVEELFEEKLKSGEILKTGNWYYFGNITLGNGKTNAQDALLKDPMILQAMQSND